MRSQPKLYSVGDLRQLRNATLTAVDKTPFPTVAHFRATAQGVVCGYLRGKQIPVTKKRIRDVLNGISDDAKKRLSEEGRRWDAWVGKLNSQIEEAQPRNQTFDRSFFPDFLQRDSYELTGDFKVWVMNKEKTLVLVGPRMRIIKSFTHPDELKWLGLSLIDVSHELEVELGLFEARLEASDGEAAINHWEHLIQWGISDDDCQ